MQTRLWQITLLITFLLVVATIGLAVQAQNQPVMGVDAQVNGRFYLRDAPYGGAQVMTVLRGGTDVTIIDSTEQGKSTWYQIEIGEQTGWLPSTAVTIKE